MKSWMRRKADAARWISLAWRADSLPPACYQNPLLRVGEIGQARAGAHMRCLLVFGDPSHPRNKAIGPMSIRLFRQQIKVVIDQ
jgi:hypothetical protein